MVGPYGEIIQHAAGGSGCGSGAPGMARRVSRGAQGGRKAQDRSWEVDPARAGERIFPASPREERGEREGGGSARTSQTCRPHRTAR